MSQVLITGATGLVGDHLLRLLIQDRRVNYIAAPTRRPLADISGVFNPHDPQLTDALAQETGILARQVVRKEGGTWLAGLSALGIFSED